MQLIASHVLLITQRLTGMEVAASAAGLLPWQIYVTCWCLAALQHGSASSRAVCYYSVVQDLFRPSPPQHL